MARELRPIDISGMPELLKLAAELQATQQPVVLRRDSEDVAIVSPTPRKTRAKRGRAFTKDDPLFRLVGIGSSGIPGGVSGRKHEFLLEAHRQHR